MKNGIFGEGTMLDFYALIGVGSPGRPDDVQKDRR